MDIHFMRTHNFDMLLYNNHKELNQQAESLPAVLPSLPRRCLLCRLHRDPPTHHKAAGPGSSNRFVHRCQELSRIAALLGSRWVVCIKRAKEGLCTHEAA